MKKNLYILISSIMCFGLLTGCGGQATAHVANKYNTTPAAAEEAMVMATEEMTDSYDSYDLNSASGSSDNTAKNITFDESRKIIYRSSVTMETLDYDETYNKLLDIINKYEGYIQSETYSNSNNSYLNDNDVRYGINVYGTNDICVRVPRKNYFDFMEDGLALGNVIDRVQTVDDKTASYATNQSHIDILNKKIKYYDSQLNKLSKKLDEAIAEDNSSSFEQILRDMEYMANMKADVEAQFIPYKQSNDQIDAESSYSTINLTIREVKEFTKPEIELEPTFRNRAKRAFINSMKRFVLWIENIIIILINMLPAILILAIPIILALPVIIVVVIIKKRKFSSKKTIKKDKQSEIKPNDNK